MCIHISTSIYPYPYLKNSGKQGGARPPRQKPMTWITHATRLVAKLRGDGNVRPSTKLFYPKGLRCHLMFVDCLSIWGRVGINMGSIGIDPRSFHPYSFRRKHMLICEFSHLSIQEPVTHVYNYVTVSKTCV